LPVLYDWFIKKKDRPERIESGLDDTLALE
jgi:hypothetical protein